MKRRKFLATVGLGSLTGIAGCLGSESDGENSSQDDSDETGGGRTQKNGEPSGYYVKGSEGFPATVCEEHLNKDFILAITEPEFDSTWDGYEMSQRYLYNGRLTNSTKVIGIEREGKARAYPISVVQAHEIVNDSFDVPIIVTFCPLCNSGMTAVREVQDEETVFGVSGLLWKPPGIDYENAVQENKIFGAGSTKNPEPKNSGNLVMYDVATESYWSQILVQAICGPMLGNELEILPSTFTTWGKWKKTYPDAEALLPPPHSGTIDV